MAADRQGGDEDGGSLEALEDSVKRQRPY